jgi:dolichyl-phosphate-mannose--protein O-mannosyl transferase/Gpi18-like mannosyltransferase
MTARWKKRVSSRRRRGSTPRASFKDSFKKERVALRKAVSLRLLGILAVGLIVRLLLLGADGFTNDVSTFESWSLTLVDHPLRDFYAKAGFADYPPGYFLVLWLTGHLYRFFTHADPQWSILKTFVKMPAVLADLGCGALLYAIVRRAAKSEAWALGAAALFVLNPAMIFISAYWGQVDSVAALMTLSAILFIVASEERRGASLGVYVAFAWLFLAYSILIKPPAAVLAPLFLAYALVGGDREQRGSRLSGTGAGILGSLFLAYVVSSLFHPEFNPIEQGKWLFERYRYASGVYPYNTVNAFNIYAIRWSFWQPDGVRLFSIGRLGVTQYLLGIVTVLAAMGFVLERYVQRRDIRSFLEGALLLSLAFFMLATRMHERYVFNAVVLCIALCGTNRRYLYACVAYSATLFVNLFYSLFYLSVVSGKTHGGNTADLIPWVTHPLALLNVLLFFALAYVYMDAQADITTESLLTRIAVSGRQWFSPAEGTVRMTLLDGVLASGFSAASFVLTAVGFGISGTTPYWLPKEKVFDEIYYARAAEEYLKHMEIFEFTHPPLTKLIITASTWMFGGLDHGGDTAAGWRFLNMVVGALTVGVLYLFAKRLLGSTVFASIAAGMLLFDGFHFAQSRIATPEITVAFFSLTTLYAFYRFWLAARVRVAPLVSSSLNLREAVCLLCATPLMGVISQLIVHEAFTPAWVVTFLYFELGAYLAIRLAIPRLLDAPKQVSYAEGTTISQGVLRTPDGGVLDLNAKKQQTALTHEDGDLRIEYAPTGSVRYATPQGEASFSPEGAMSVGGGEIVRGADGTFWLWALSISGGLLAASKWNGLFDFFVVWLLAAFVVAQPYLFRGRRALWGNPYGFSLDIMVAAMLFVGATIYTLSYIPYFLLPAHHNLSELIALQKQMFGYHYDLHATHPYSSQWWQWPILQIPISYYYQDFRHGAATAIGAACCVAEILALPNPVVWWTGLFSVPLLVWRGWRERNKGYLLLVTAYVIQWLPWVLSPRIAFEYHFYPNLAIIILADAAFLQRIWMSRQEKTFGTFSLPNLLAAAFLSALVAVPVMWATPGGRLYADAAALGAFMLLFAFFRAYPRFTVGAYVAATLAAFIFWYPITAATPLSWNAWNARMLTQLEGNNWINPHPGQ